MTRKITISVPDDVAEQLDREPNASAYLTEAARRRMAADRTRQILVDAGFAITDEGLARERARIDALRASVTPELRRAAEELRARIASGRPW